MTTHTEQQVRNQIVCRLVNERVHHLAVRVDGVEPHGYLCECTNAECTETIVLYAKEYEPARSSPVFFLVAPGHEKPAAERTVEASERFVLVEKLVGTDLVTETDPRTNGGNQTTAIEPVELLTAAGPRCGEQAIKDAPS